jgi:RNA polymerase sigma-70 factor (ECF subfamily)
LVSRYHHRLLSYVKSHIRDGCAEDIVQDTWSALLDALAQNKYDFQKVFCAWIFQTAGNRIKRKFTEKKRRPQADFDEENTANPEVNFIEKIKDKWLNQALMQLSLHYREIICMRYFEKLSEHEIAQRLHIAEGTVSSIIRQSLEKMYGYLKKHIAEIDKD